MQLIKKCIGSWIRLTCLLVFTGWLSSAAWAVEVGKQAPEFNLPATTGTNVSLKDFRGKSWVLIEFYGADFAPT